MNRDSKRLSRSLRKRKTECLRKWKDSWKYLLTSFTNEVAPAIEKTQIFNIFWGDIFQELLECKTQVCEQTNSRLKYLPTSFPFMLSHFNMGHKIRSYVNSLQPLSHQLQVSQCASAVFPHGVTVTSSCPFQRLMLGWNRFTPELGWLGWNGFTPELHPSVKVGPGYGSGHLAHLMFGLGLGVLVSLLGFQLELVYNSKLK